MRISGILAADTFAATKVEGALAGEHTMENVVMAGSHGKDLPSPYEPHCQRAANQDANPVVVSGKEAEMALKGALTTPGSQTPLAILDLGGGSTDAALIDSAGHVTSIHHAGAGEMVTRIINLELNLDDRDTAELIKKFPLAKVEGLLYLRFEDSSVKFVSEPLPPRSTPGLSW